MSGSNPAELERLQQAIGHQFRAPDLLREALTHRSAAHQRATGRGKRATRGAGSNERLEFIGDRVLGLLMAEWLLERYPAEQEGALGSRHAQLVSRTTLAEVALALDIPAALDVAAHEERIGIRNTANVLADAVEALLGALYLDDGLAPARVLVRRFWTDAIVAQGRPPKDPKTALQEWALARGLALPAYEMLSADGPSHAPRFVVQAHVAGFSGQGEAGNKRAAESAAAADLLTRFGASS
ncbi:ribonuclease III [Acetobacter nitrogenifigens DSM 23921 = NBRC 105050]|uniref:Ribonuclease 3 n=1 Tax=Acetobacter nitrogenifigens DSM 23921 = NBRC 105050 TaxID=1120919 RepID=A0A511X723_9PROT|nr:ribonuclease III [Acetobacter nitrogenifigens]GBQ95243.1 ribonuclease III [Acetobacter nitrogenifigens DSM 23921 = NBRC 105050]GEN58757.1 ribonuclease 3 [Acetobacter nitrogenifigens DSM 23921 = NBRC 105050]